MTGIHINDSDIEIGWRLLATAQEIGLSVPSWDCNLTRLLDELMVRVDEMEKRIEELEEQ